jgi:glycosyltransferase involved in cell wall biosynthesis
LACLIKPATHDTRGILTLTTQERDHLIYSFEDLRDLLSQVKQRYAIGVHHNWHDYGFRYNELFDFHMAGTDDLKEQSGLTIPLLPMDACNFSPDCFYPAAGEKFWDILFVARAVEFKGIPEFFQAIRQLFDMGHQLRVLFVCPVPPNGGTGSMRDVRSRYEAMFSDAEQELFTLLTTDFRYPFPFDLPTIAHFYRSSKIFVHSAPDERRCRVAAYAWATAMPVVGMAPVGSVLSPSLQREPYFFEISKYEDFPKQILRALEIADHSLDFSEVEVEIASKQSIALLQRHLDILFDAKSWQRATQPGWTRDLDIRLGRHHGLPSGNNRIHQDLGGFLAFLAKADEQSLAELLNHSDPEVAIAKLNPREPRPLAVEKTPYFSTLVQTMKRVVRKIGAMA